MMTVNEIIRAGYSEHHTAWARRYVSRKGDGEVESYSGRFGTGYKVYTPSWDSTTYCRVTYYVA